MLMYEMLYGRRCKTLISWGDIRQNELESLEIVKATAKRLEKIEAYMKATKDRQKPNAKKRRPI